MKKKVIIVTDGDKIAQKAVETAAGNIGGRCISLSAGNPTVLTGERILELIKQAQHDPVVVMVDDRGDNGFGSGERAMDTLLKSHEIDVLGILAVASNTPHAHGVRVNCSVDKQGNITNRAVDKHGNETDTKIIKGDTVNSLSEEEVPFVVGVGDPGKMDGSDDCNIGAPIITKGLEEILNHATVK